MAALFVGKVNPGGRRRRCKEWLYAVTDDV
jgi:hypothetical protein